MITALRTNNFKKLESFSASFMDGTNLVFGENGEGKSTAFDAIRFALFGSKGVTGTVDSLTTWNKTGMWVELDISGHTIRRTASNCKITEDGNIVASGNSPCVKYVENLLSCSVKDFDLLYMSKQNETAGLITFGATELNRKVEEYAGVAVIDKVIKNLGSEINGCQIALKSFEFIPVDGLKTELTKTQGQLKSEVDRTDSVSKAVDNLRGELYQTNEKLKSARAFNHQQDLIAERNEKIIRRIDQAQAAVNASKQALDNAFYDLSELTPIDDQELARLHSDLSKVKSTNLELAKLPAEADLIAEIEEAQDKETKQLAFERMLPELESSVSQCQKKVDELKESHSEKVRAYRDAERKAKDGICTGCNRPLEDHDPEAAEAHKQAAAKAVSNSKTLLDSALTTRESAEEQLREHNKKNPGTGWAEKRSLLESKLNDVKSKRKQLEQVLASLELQDTLEGKISVLVSDQAIYQQKLKAHKSAEADHKQNMEELQTVHDMQTEQPQPKQETTELEELVSSMASKLNDAMSSLGTHKGEVKVLEERIKSINNQLASAEANNIKMAELSYQKDTATQLRKFLNDERVKFMEGVWRTILGTASNFINKSTDGWITSVGRNDKGDFTFTEKGYEAVAKESASGAQKAFIGTAIKVGLAQAKMGSSAMIMLDEPTADMRDDRASQLAAGLMMLSGQKIMITHRDSERMIAQNIIHVGD